MSKIIDSHRYLFVSLRNLIKDDSQRLDILLVDKGNQISFLKVLKTHFKFGDNFIKLVAESVELFYLYHIFQILILPMIIIILLSCQILDLHVNFLELLIDDLLMLNLRLIKLRLKLNFKVLVLLLYDLLVLLELLELWLEVL